MSIVQNGRALEAALQRLQGPAARGQLLVKATGAAARLPRGACLAPIDGNALDRRGSAFVRTNPATSSATEHQGAWTVTAAGTLVDAEAVQGGLYGNRDGGTTYRFDPAIEGIEPLAVAEPAGVTGGSWVEALGALRQVTIVEELKREPNVSLLQSNTFELPAAIISWGGVQPLDGGQASRPGPRPARVSSAGTLYKITWFVHLCSDDLTGDPERTVEGLVLLGDVLEVLQDARRVRERAFVLSLEPGAMVVSAGPFARTPTLRVDQVTIETTFVLEHRPVERVFNPWLRSRIKVSTPVGAPPANDPPLEIPNLIVPMPPDGPGPGPYP